MPWPTWDQAALAAALGVVLAWALRRIRADVARALEPAAMEFALVAALYSVWRVARMLPLATDSGAMERGRDIDRIQQALHLPTELSLQ
ncbi:MAG TPA: inositol phosphorylceramide synthase, partial [Marmoricola sp.]